MQNDENENQEKAGSSLAERELDGGCAWHGKQAREERDRQVNNVVHNN